ncbi:MAG: hypothetical protein JNG84_12965, partial [Archangium sp.]|nr:hypothetical protein [Archangium sp.]
MVKTFVTKGSSGKSIAVGVYKYTPGPPTPGFVPAPGVNVAESSKLKNGSDTVFFDGESVMLKSSTVGSSGDPAAQ